MRKLFGAEVQYFRLEQKYWEKILTQLKECGFNFVSAYVPWGLHEIEKGKFDFEGRNGEKTNLIKYLELVKKTGLKMAIRPGPFICNEFVYGGYPERIVKDNPEIFVLDYQNRTTKGYWIPKREGSQPSYLHPEYLEECNIWISAISEVIKPFLSENGGPIEMINLDNEVSYIVMDSMFDSDYNSVMVGKNGYYHKFLKNKYKNTENLPDIPFYRVKKFTDIHAPRKLIEVEKNIAYYFDWIEFKEWVMSEYLKRLRLMYEKNKVKNITFYTNLNPHRPEGVPTNPKKFEDAVKGIVGYDFYRSPFLSFSGYASMARILRYLSSTLKFTWSAEFMAGWWTENVGNAWLTPEHHKFMSLAAISNGCKGISYFMFHDRETWGTAPVSNRGNKRSVYYALKDVLKIVNNLDNWENLKTLDDGIKIAYYRPYHWHTYLGDPSPCNDSEIHKGQPIIGGLESGLLTEEYEGIFRLLLLGGYIPSIVEMLDNPEELKNCKVLFFPTGPFIDKETEKKLSEFVKNGGVLVCGPFVPSSTPHGKEIKFFNGMIRTEFVSKNEASRVEIELEKYIFKVEGGKPVISIDGFSVVSMFNYGKGKVYFIGSFIGQKKPEDEPLENINFLKSILEKEGIKPSIETKTPPVEYTKGGENGLEKYYEKRQLVIPSILSDGNSTYVFLNNLYLRSVETEVIINNKNFMVLKNIETGEKIKSGDKVVIDCKASSIFKVEQRSDYGNRTKRKTRKN